MRDFDTLEPQGFEFAYKGKRYILREAPEATVMKYRGVVTGNIKYDLDGKPKDVNPAGMVGLNAVLVAGCTFEVLLDRQGKPTGEERGPITEALVQSWPHSMVEELTAEANRLTPNLHGKSDESADSIADGKGESAEKNALLTPARTPSEMRNGSTLTSATATS